MKANELRIGNYILRNGLPCTVEIINGETSEIHFLGKDFYFSDFDENLEAIPLTEEWLVKFGFEKFVYEDEDVGYGTEYKLKASQDVFMVYSDDFSVGLYSDEYGEKNDIAVIPTFENNKYVHQLQNLYFALTGKELIP
jgi:hypothetical protein